MSSSFKPSQARSPACEELERYWFGSDALTDACAAPGTWIVVYQVRPLELVAHLMGIPFRPYRPTKAVIYEKDARTYHCLDATKVFGPWVGVLRGPTPFRRVWDHCPTFDAWFYRGSDRLERWSTALWRFLRSTPDRLAEAVHSARQS